jgi:hypothetical protein
MKKYLFITSITALIINFTLMGQITNNQFYKQKIHSYTFMRNAGIVLTGAGTLTAITAGVLLTSYLSEYPYNQKKYNAGMQCVVSSCFMFAGGIILWKIGSKGRKVYKRKLDSLSFDMYYTPDKQGIVLSYRF